MNYGYIVELQAGVWISSWGVTLVQDNAKKYASMSSATYALAYHRRRHDYLSARVVNLEAPHA